MGGERLDALIFGFVLGMIVGAVILGLLMHTRQVMLP